MIRRRRPSPGQGPRDRAGAAPASAAAAANAKARFEAGLEHLRAGRLAQATAAFEEAVAIDPGYAQAHSNLGVVLKRQGKLKEAVAAYRRAIESAPDYATAHSNLGNALRELGELKGAAAACGRAVEIDPSYAQAYSNLGLVLREQAKYADAVAACRKAVELKPDYADAHNNLGYALLGQGKLAAAIAACREAAALRPGYVGAHWNEAFTLLLAGDFEAGWEKYEWRWRKDEFLAESRRFPQGAWDGAALGGGTILLHAEQGIGDTLQFVRYAPLVAARAARVIVECQRGLERLMATVAGVGEVVVKGDPLPEYSAHAPFLSLPRIFGTRLETVPAEVPYISVPADMEPPPFAPAYATQDGALRVGIVWAGSPAHSNDRNRSCPLEPFARLRDIAGVTLFSLQVGPQAAALGALPPGPAIADLGKTFTDFAATAMAVSRLDLVVTVDTAMAHLVGAMGRPVWVLLPYAPDWRWLLDRDDSPWYPTMRLFRQPRPRDWDEVFARVSAELEGLAARRGEGRAAP